MSDLNIRNIPADLKAKAKATAYIEGKTLREAIIELLEGYTAKTGAFTGLNAAHCPVNGPLIGKKRTRKEGAKR